MEFFSFFGAGFAEFATNVWAGFFGGIFQALTSVFGGA